MKIVAELPSASPPPSELERRRQQARAIWQAGVDAVRPVALVEQAIRHPTLAADLKDADRVLVLGGGKAGSAMSAAVENALANRLDRVEGVVNVPAGTEAQLRAIRLVAGRAQGSNEPTEAGVAGVRAMIELARRAGPSDVGLCLISGGGSALLPLPAEGLTLADKQQVTRLLMASGANIAEMNAVRKHLSGVKGGRLAQAFRGQALHSLIISDVIGDPIDVIASGPTAPDPTTFADALQVLDRHGLGASVPAAVLRHLESGVRGELPETPKCLPASVHNHVIGSNRVALRAAQRRAEELGYRVVNLGAFIAGETAAVARTVAEIVTSILADGTPAPAPVCVLLGGETTVRLTEPHGLGGRNQEFALAALLALGDRREATILSGGSDGEDGPTDAAGAVVDSGTLERARQLGLDPSAALATHDAYPFFDATGDLLRTGLTGTNVMDLRVILIGEASNHG